MTIRFATSPFRVNFEVVTPERARELLDNNIDNNRSVSLARVKRYAEDIEGGHWVTTHQGIAVDEKGRLLDGQHRLHAVIQTGKPITAMVCTDIPSDVFPMMDGGLTRSAASFLEGPYATSRASLARVLLLLDRNGGSLSASSNSGGSGSVPSHEVLRYLEEHPDVMDYGVQYSRMANRATSDGKFPATTRVGLLFGGYISMRHDEWWSDVDSLANGDGLPDGNPVKALWKASPLGHNASTVSLFRTAWAAIKYRNRESIRQLRVDTSRKIQVW